MIAPALAQAISSRHSLAAPTASYELHSIHQTTFQNSSSLSQTYCEGHVGISLRTNPPFNRGEHSANKHIQTDTPECSDWLADQFSRQSAKEISEKTGQGQRAAEAVKMGRNGLTMAHLVNICRADPKFRAAFFQFCGGHLEGSPEMVAALSHAINAVMQKGGAP